MNISLAFFPAWIKWTFESVLCQRDECKHPLPKISPTVLSLASTKTIGLRLWCVELQHFFSQRFDFSHNVTCFVQQRWKFSSWSRKRTICIDVCGGDQVTPDVISKWMEDAPTHQAPTELWKKNASRFGLVKPANVWRPRGSAARSGYQRPYLKSGSKPKPQSHSILLLSATSLRDMRMCRVCVAGKQHRQDQSIQVVQVFLNPGISSDRM